MYVYIVVLFGLLQSADVFGQAQDPVGIVFIGQDENDTTSLFTFNENYVSDFEIPVLLFMMNATTGEILFDPPTAPVDVTCETSLDQIGYTQAAFSVSRISAGIISGTVQFSNPIPAREVDLRCWGESDIGDEFTKETSLSEPVLFEVRAAGSVSISDAIVQVANEASNIDVEGTFIVELSETIEDYNVTLTCAQDGTGVVGPMSLQFTPQLVLTGFRKALMAYQLVTRGSPVTVYCTAQSQKPTEGQFQTATSNGFNATFALVEGAVKLVPERSDVHTIQFNAYLALDSTPTADVIFACYLRMADNSTHAKSLAANPICVMPDNIGPIRPPTNGPGVTGTAATTTPAPAVTTPAPNVPANVTGEWQLRNQIYIFEANSDSYRQVIVERTLNVQTATDELFVVTCCAPSDTNDSPKYENQSTALVVASYLTPYYPIKWNNATTIEERELETEILHPGYVEVSTCPCDLTEGLCDADCCCDTDCTSDDVETFECIPGIYGGNTSTPPRYMCNADYPNKEDWFSIMCVQWNSSGFLGYYYFGEAALRDLAEYDTTADQFRSPFRYQEEDDRFPPESTVSGFGYQESNAVRTGLSTDSPTEDYHIGDNYRLTLPKPSLGGECVWSSPVQFLREATDSCTWLMKESLCNAYTPLSALIYAQSDRWSGSKGPLVLTTAGVSEITTTNVNYLCAESTAGYVRSTERYQDLVESGQKYLFDFELPDEGDCEFDLRSGAYVCVNQTSELVADELPPRCSWDDGFTKPPAPSQVGDSCANSILEVLYNFTWQGTSLIYLNATVILGAVPLSVELADNSTVPSHLTQQFDVLYHHEMQVMEVVNETDTDTNETYMQAELTHQYKRSGNPGYEFGLAVLSGLAMYELDNSTGDEEFLYVDSNASNRLKLWSPGIDGLCYNAGRQELEFGVSVLGSCVLKLSLEDLQDCYSLRRLVLNRQDSLMLSSHVSKGGDPDYFYLDTDWVPVFRQDLQELLDNTTDFMTTVDPFTTESTTARDTTTVSGSTTAAFNQTESYLDQISGRCTNIPSGIHVDIMYAEVGQKDAVPIVQVVGAKVSYTLSTWRLYCVGPDGTACYTNATWIQEMTSTGGNAVQSFMLSSSVNYLKVPATDPQPVTKYQEENSPRVWKCKQDACWEETFYPFLKINPGDDQQYTLSVGLISLVFICGLFMVVRPISRWDYIHVQL